MLDDLPRNSRSTLLLLAAIICSTFKITHVASYCVVTEDVSDDRKSDVFGILLVIASIGGLATAFEGPAIERFGLVPSQRFLAAVSIFRRHAK